MQNARDSDSRCLACDVSARDAKSLAMWVERCEPLRLAVGMKNLVRRPECSYEKCSKMFPKFWGPFCFGRGPNIFCKFPSDFLLSIVRRGAQEIGQRAPALRAVTFCCFFVASAMLPLRVTLSGKSSQTTKTPPELTN